MNGERIENEPTPEGRIAAVAVTLIREMRKKFSRPPDYADMRDAIRAQVRKELTRARVAEAKECERPDRVEVLKKIL